MGDDGGETIVSVESGEKSSTSLSAFAEQSRSSGHPDAAADFAETEVLSEFAGCEPLEKIAVGTVA